MTTRAEYEARRDRWADALESGEYEQGEEWLCSDGKYCCLGVACEVFTEELGLSRSTHTSHTQWEGCFHVVPDILVAFLGVHGESGRNAKGTEELTFLNDNGTTFIQIANMLRAEPEQWFTWAGSDA